MSLIFLMIIIIGFALNLCVSLYTMIFIFKRRSIYSIRFTTVLNFLLIFNAAIIYSILYITSVLFLFSEAINILLWKIFVVLGFISLFIISLIYTCLEEIKKIPYFPFLVFSTLFGLLIGSFFSPDSVQIFINSLSSPPFLVNDLSIVNYRFNIITGLIILIYQLFSLIYYFSVSYIIYSKARNKESVKWSILNVFAFIIPFLMYILYIYYIISVFRELHIIFVWIYVFLICYELVKKPELFSELTNKIYYLNIYHKSGILLYSYQFGPENNQVDSTIWGNILIGMNHILSEFVDPKDQIEVIQTDSSDIIVNYNNLGFAVVLITNRKNPVLKKLMDKFAIEFKEKYKNELIEIQDLNKLINVSEFKETKGIIERNFQMYL